MRYFVIIVALCAVVLHAQPPVALVYRDEPLAWQLRYIGIAWEFDEKTDKSEVKKFNDSVELTLATVDGYRGSFDVGGENKPPVSNNLFQQMGVLRLQGELGLMSRDDVVLTGFQKDTLNTCRIGFASFSQAVHFRRFQLSLKISLYNKTAADIVLEGSGELPIAFRGRLVGIAKPIKPLKGLIIPCGNTNGIDIVFGAEIDSTEVRSVLAAAIEGLSVNFVHAQIRALQGDKDLRLRMDLNGRLTYQFAISNGNDDLITWRVKKRGGAHDAELTVSDVIAAITAEGLKDDQGQPLFKIKDGRCIGVGCLPIVGKEYALVADHGKDKRFFIGDWPLSTPILGDVCIRILRMHTSNFKDYVDDEVVLGVSRYEELTHDPFAQVLLGECNKKGIGVSKNEKEAAGWYRKAAAQNNGFAMYCLSDCYVDGIGLEQSEHEAVRLLRQAAELGDGDAQFRFGHWCEIGSHVNESIQDAIKWYRKGAEQEDMYSQYHLGKCYAKGIGVKKDEHEAFKWYGLSARKAYARAMSALGMCYLDGKGVGKDEKEALKWFRKSAAKEDGLGLSEIGFCYMQGLGVEKCEREAVKWTRLSAERGYGTGQNNLGYFYKNGIGVERDGREAVKWLRLAVDQGIFVAYKTLGLCYLEGLGVEKDEAEGIRLLHKAVDLGVESAKDELKKIGK